MTHKTLIIAAIALSTSFVYADGHLSGDGAIEARQAAMKLVGKSAKAGDFAALNEAAIAAKAAFAADTTQDGSLPTKATANIWSDPDGFNALMDEMIDKSAAGDRAVFGTCKACHSDYRS